MAPRTSRPPSLQTLNIPTIVIHHAEPTAGLTPRTPFSQDPNDEVIGQYVDDMQIKVHLSPSAPITPVQPRIPRNKSAVRAFSRPQPKAKPNRSWRVAMWSAVLAIFVTALLSLLNMNFKPRHSAPPSAYNHEPMQWITITQQKNPATPVVYPTLTPAVTHTMEAPKSSRAA